MNIELVPYNREILKGFYYDGVDHKLSGNYINDIAEYYCSLGTGYICIIDNKLIGVGGVYPLWKDWGSAWLFLNKGARDYKKSIFKLMLDNLSSLIDKYKIEVLCVQCIDDSLEAYTLINHLGFVKSNEVKMSLYVRKTT